MSDKSSIEWTATVQADGTVTPGATWNPIRGTAGRHTCARISPGCDNCYAATMNRRGLMGTAPLDYGTGETLLDAARLDEKALLQPLKWKTPRKVFVCSMTDLFGAWVPDEWLDRIFAVMAMAQQHTFIVLTKRPKRMQEYLSGRREDAVKAALDDDFDAVPGGAWEWPLPNVWVGVTIEEDRYSWRANYLRQTPAAVRWVSAEPLIGGLPSLDLTDIDWLVAGGESGPKSRPMHPDWARDLRDRCAAAGTAYFFKQWGAWAPTEIVPGGDLGGDLRRGRTVHLHAPGNPEGYFRAGDAYMTRVGNHRSGRLLDGREWNEYPAVKA